MIHLNNPVCAAFAGCSTGRLEGRYYTSKEDAMSAFDAQLKDYGYHLQHRVLADRSGFRTIPVWDNDYNIIAYAHFTHKEVSVGCWEVLGYIT